MKRLYINLASLRNKVECMWKGFTGVERMIGDSQTPVFQPPASVKGMEVLDRDAFSKDVKMRALLVPQASLHKFRKGFKNDLFATRRALVKPKPVDGMYLTVKRDFDFSKVHPAKLGELKKLNVEQKLHDVTIEVRYENYNHREILGAIMPEGVTPNSGYSRVGHIAHLNLLEEQKPFRNIIGQVLLDTHSSLKTVVDKTCIIDNTYRNFEMDVIAGEHNFITEASEHGFRFQLDFSKVFWNSRLGTEHRRIYDAIPRESTVFDVFAGVGPFAIPLAKKGCKVYANDLNAESHKWLCHNAKLNKTTINAFNLDGRQFIKQELAKYLRSKPEVSKVYVIMNLPGHAVDFLDALPGILCEESSTDVSGVEVTEKDIPSVHVFCYVFSSAENMIEDVQKRAATSLGQSLPAANDVREVRKVSPKKEQFCLSFELPGSTFFRTISKNPLKEPEAKKMKLAA